LAKQDDYFGDSLDYDGPSCYELGIKTPDGKTITRVYVGHTKNEERRMYEYGFYGAHLYNKIDKALGKGFILHYRAQAKKTTSQAKRMEKQLLRKRYYAWNTQVF
jgi:hypothetical protein